MLTLGSRGPEAQLRWRAYSSAFRASRYVAAVSPSIC